MKENDSKCWVTANTDEHVELEISKNADLRAMCLLL